MEGSRLIGKVCLSFLIGAISLFPSAVYGQEVIQPADDPASSQVVEEPGVIHNLVNGVLGYVDPENAEITTVHQLACLIDHLDKCLDCKGQVVVKNPDVWGQNRMTQASR